MDYTKFDDPTLLRLVTRQDENALGALYDRFSRLVYSMALNVVNDEAAAEEITQDVFLNVWKKASSYDVSHAKVVTWIASIARHRAIDILRARSVRPVNQEFSWEEEPLLEIASPLDVEKEAELHQRQQKVRLALTKLPQDQRKVMALAYFGGYSHSEMAKMLNEPIGTVKTRLRLAMQKLRQFLDEERIQESGSSV
jgi:RNA polymerase sigma-70 factor (ECF subfamily)